jgi:hypothetical protein
MNNKLDIDGRGIPKKAGRMACHNCFAKSSLLYKVTRVAGKTVVGLGVGVTMGVGALALAGAAEVAIPAILTFKALGLTGSALGFLHGAKEFKKKRHEI